MHFLHWFSVFIAALTFGCFDYSATTEGNNPPVAVVAETNIIADLGDTVLLDGSGSTDADGDELSFRWYQLGGGSLPVNIESPTAPVASVTAPIARAGLFFALEVSDGIDVSAPVVVELRVRNRPPTVLPISSVVSVTGRDVSLLADGSDPDGDELTYLWTLKDWPEGGEIVMRDITSRVVSLTPSVRSKQTQPGLCALAECYRVAVQAFDGELWSEEVVATVVSLNRAPVAQAGEDQNLSVGKITLDASDSYDPDDDTLSYTWAQLEGANLDLSGADASSPYFVVPPPRAGTYIFELTVSDTQEESTDSVRIDIARINLPPTVVAPQPQFLAPEKSNYAIALEVTDPDSTQLSVSWVRLEGSRLWPQTLSGAEAQVPVPSFAALAENNDDSWVKYEVVASDGIVESAPIEITLYAIPSDTGFVFVGGPDAVDDDPCGTRASPCATVRWALTQIKNGQDLVLGEGSYLQPGGVNDNPITWKAQTSLFASRNMTDFSRAGRSTISTWNNIFSNEGILFDVTIGSDVMIRDVTLKVKKGQKLMRKAIDCDQCAARFVNVSVNCQPGNALIGILLRNNATPTFENVDVACLGLPASAGVAIAARTGSIVKLTRSTLRFSAVEDALDNSALQVDATSSAVLDSVQFVLNGVNTRTDTVPAQMIDNAGSLVLQNSVIHVQKMSPFVAINNTGSLFAFHNTIIGSAGSGDSGVGISSTGVATMVGNIIAGFPQPIRLIDAGTNSLFAGNAIAPLDTAFAVCDDTSVASALFLAGTTGSTCNSTNADWLGNIEAACSLVAIQTGDYHLNSAVDNPCIDGGVAVTSAGELPALDMDQEPRPGGNGQPDIGADEAQ